MAHCYLTRKGGGGSSANFMTQAQWDALSFNQKQAAGLTLIGSPTDTGGDWHDFSNLSNTYIDFGNPLLSNMSYGTTGIDEVFTATKSGYYLVLNYESVGEAGNTHRSGATTTTTGTFAWKDTQSLDFNGTPNQRDTTFDLALVRLQAGQTITLNNNHNNYWSAQVHLVVEAIAEFTATADMVKSVYVGGTTGYQQTFTASLTATYIVFAIDNCPSGQQPSAAFVLHGAQELSHYTASINRNALYIGEYVMAASDTIDMTTSNNDSYATKSFAAWSTN